MAVRWRFLFFFVFVFEKESGVSRAGFELAIVAKDDLELPIPTASTS